MAEDLFLGFTLGKFGRSGVIGAPMTAHLGLCAFPVDLPLWISSYPTSQMTMMMI